MSSGGKRKGAGRPKGSMNRRTLSVIAGAQAAGVMPLDFMLQVMRDQNIDTAARMDMAKAAAPYLHPRLSSVEFRPTSYDLSKLSDEELEELGRLTRLMQTEIG